MLVRTIVDQSNVFVDTRGHGERGVLLHYPRKTLFTFTDTYVFHCRYDMTTQTFFRLTYGHAAVVVVFLYVANIVTAVVTRPLFPYIDSNASLYTSLRSHPRFLSPPSRVYIYIPEVYIYRLYPDPPRRVGAPHTTRTQ